MICDSLIVEYQLVNDCHMTVFKQKMPPATAGTMFTLDFCLAGGTVIAGKVEQGSTFLMVPQAAAGCREQSVHIRNKLPGGYHNSIAGDSRRQLRLYVNQALLRKILTIDCHYDLHPSFVPNFEDRNKRKLIECKRNFTSLR